MRGFLIFNHFNTTTGPVSDHLFKWVITKPRQNLWSTPIRKLNLKETVFSRIKVIKNQKSPHVSLFPRLVLT